MHLRVYRNFLQLQQEYKINIVGLCNLINLVETENTEGRQANGEQIRNILNVAWPDKSNPLVIDTIIDGLLGLNLIEPSDD